MDRKQTLLQKLREDVLAYDKNLVAETAQAIVNERIDVLEAINVASAAMAEIGNQFQSGDIYLPQLMLAGEAMKACMNVLTAHLNANDKPVQKGKVVIGAVQGDIHDIGKNLVASMLGVNGFQVVDLGVNVPPAKFVSAAESENAKIIAMSALMTTSMPYQKDVIALLKERGLRDKFYVVIGGGPVTSEFATESGVDGWGQSAVSAVKVCNQLLSTGKVAASGDPILEK